MLTFFVLYHELFLLFVFEQVLLSFIVSLVMFCFGEAKWFSNCNSLKFYCFYVSVEHLLFLYH